MTDTLIFEALGKFTELICLPFLVTRPIYPALLPIKISHLIRILSQSVIPNRWLTLIFVEDLHLEPDTKRRYMLSAYSGSLTSHQCVHRRQFEYQVA